MESLADWKLIAEMQDVSVPLRGLSSWKEPYPLAYCSGLLRFSPLAGISFVERSIVAGISDE